MIRAMLVTHDERLPVEFDIEPLLVPLERSQRMHVVGNLVRGNLSGYAAESLAEQAVREGLSPELAERMADVEFTHGEPNATVIVHGVDLQRWINAADSGSREVFGDELARRIREQDATHAALARWFTTP